jgi:hypothetical protein
MSIKKLGDQYIVSFVLSVSKYMNKFTSTFEIASTMSEGIKKCYKDALGVFHKS